MKRISALAWSPAFLAAVLLLGVYGARTVYGLVGGLAYARAFKLVEQGEYEEALPLFERADIGFYRAEVVRWRAYARGRIWRAMIGKGDPPEETVSEFAGATRDYLAAVSASPVASRPWAGLAELYDRVELMDREGEVGDPNGREGSWEDVGRSGVIAIGLLRKAIERVPARYENWDQLTLMLLRYGLREPAMDAVRSSAKAHPAFRFHSFRYLKPIPDDLLSNFSEAAREALGSAPMLNRREHLVELGGVERQRGRLEQAETDLRAALNEPRGNSSRAFAHYPLGMVLMEQGRLEEARKELLIAQEEPTYRAASLNALATVAERQGDLAEAFRLLSELRRADPRNVTHCLRAALVARRLKNWPAAKEALRWAAVLAPDDPRSRFELVETLLEAGDSSAAALLFRDLVREHGQSDPDVARLRLRLEEHLDRTGS